MLICNDAANQLTKSIDALLGQMVFTYDGNGNGNVEKFDEVIQVNELDRAEKSNMCPVSEIGTVDLPRTQLSLGYFRPLIRPPRLWREVRTSAPTTAHQQGLEHSPRNVDWRFCACPA